MLILSTNSKHTTVSQTRMTVNTSVYYVIKSFLKIILDAGVTVNKHNKVTTPSSDTNIWAETSPGNLVQFIYVANFFCRTGAGS